MFCIGCAWYHFSAHPVCFGDGMAGPDWPGLVAQKLQERDGLSCSYLQGHIGDVNPGNGTPWTGDAEKVSEAVYTALHHAVNHSDHRAVSKMRVRTGAAEISFDLARWNDQLARYRSNPEQCNQGEWVDAGFARDWYESASKRRAARTLRSPISVLQLGDVGLLFHAAELYSFYGLKVRLDSPFAATLLVGYADDFIGYLTDPKAYEASEYAAIVVPKILDLPPFKPEAARQYSDALLQLARKI
jgi:neutral ceramidase